MNVEHRDFDKWGFASRRARMPWRAHDAGGCPPAAPRLTAVTDAKLTIATINKIREVKVAGAAIASPGDAASSDAMTWVGSIVVPSEPRRWMA